jgi:hypothetical protein
MPSLLAKECLIEDLDLDQWKRLAALAMHHWRQRRLYVAHEGGRVVGAYDTEKGGQPLPCAQVDDAQALAERLLAERQADGVAAVWVLDQEAYHAAIGAAERGLDASIGVDAYLGQEWLARFQAPGCGYAPKSDFLFYGLPWERLTRFTERMLPASCTFVLGVFDGDALWASCFAQIQDGRIVGLSTSAGLDPDDVKDVVGRDQHPFLLATVANRYRRPAFGWFCQREDFEAYMRAGTVEAKDGIFQTALMKNRATFDFNILIDRGVTPLAPLDPGSQAVDGGERGDNPRTRIPDPDEPGPTAL